MTALSTTQSIWTWLDCGGFAPPESKAKPRSTLCWLCGGSVGDNPWPRKKAFGLTFTDFAEVARLESDAVCQACVALSKSEGWEQYCNAHPERGFKTHFPQKEGKRQRAFNWLYMSHLFTPATHETPSWARWRELLVTPPAPPFVAVFALSGKQQIMFKAKVSLDSDLFYVQADQVSLAITPIVMSEIIGLIEMGMAMGIPRGALASGQYTSQSLRGVSIPDYLKLESRLDAFRKERPDYMMLTEKVAQKHE